MVVGGMFAALPPVRSEMLKYPAVYRGQGQISHMAIGVPPIFLAMVVLTILYALLYKGGAGFVEGARFGLLIAPFSVCTFVLHNLVNLNVGSKIALHQTIGYSFIWIVVGIVIGLVFRPAR